MDGLCEVAQDETKQFVESLHRILWSELVVIYYYGGRTWQQQWQHNAWSLTVWSGSDPPTQVVLERCDSLARRGILLLAQRHATPESGVFVGVRRGTIPVGRCHWCVAWWGWGRADKVCAFTLKEGLLGSSQVLVVGSIVMLISGVGEGLCFEELREDTRRQ